MGYLVKDMIKFSNQQLPGPKRIQVTMQEVTEFYSVSSCCPKTEMWRSEKGEWKEKEGKRERRGIDGKATEGTESFEGQKMQHPLKRKRYLINKREKELREKLEGFGQLFFDGNSKVKNLI